MVKDACSLSDTNLSSVRCLLMSQTSKKTLGWEEYPSVVHDLSVVLSLFPEILGDWRRLPWQLPESSHAISMAYENICYSPVPTAGNVSPPQWRVAKRSHLRVAIRGNCIQRLISILVGKFTQNASFLALLLVFFSSDSFTGNNYYSSTLVVLQKSLIPNAKDFGVYFFRLYILIITFALRRAKDWESLRKFLSGWHQTWRRL